MERVFKRVTKPGLPNCNGITITEAAWDKAIEDLKLRISMGEIVPVTLGQIESAEMGVSLMDCYGKLVKIDEEDYTVEVFKDIIPDNVLDKCYIGMNYIAQPVDKVVNDIECITSFSISPAECYGIGSPEDTEEQRVKAAMANFKLLYGGNKE